MFSCICRYFFCNGIFPDIIKKDFFGVGKTLVFHILRQNKYKNFTQNHIKEKKNCKIIHKFLSCTYKYQNFAQIRKICARLHNREIINFRNSAYFKLLCQKELLIFMKICPPTKQIKKRKIFKILLIFIFSCLSLKPLSKYIWNIGLH